MRSISVNFAIEYKLISMAPDSLDFHRKISRIQNLISNNLEPKFSMGSRLLKDTIGDPELQFLDKFKNLDDYCISELEKIFKPFIDSLNSDRYNKIFSLSEYNTDDFDDCRALFWVDDLSGIYFYNNLFYTAGDGSPKIVNEKSDIIDNLKYMYSEENVGFGATFVLSIDIIIKHFPIAIIN